MEALTPDLVAVQVLRDHVLLLAFADGRRGTFDFGGRMWGPVFAPLRDDYNAFCSVEMDYGTVVWKLGRGDPSTWLDWAPEELYTNCTPL